MLTGVGHVNAVPSSRVIITVYHAKSSIWISRMYWCCARMIALPYEPATAFIRDPTHPVDKIHTYMLMPYIATTRWQPCLICEATSKIFPLTKRYVASLELIGTCRNIQSCRSLSPRGPTAASATRSRRCESKRAHIKRDVQRVLYSNFLRVG